MYAHIIKLSWIGFILINLARSQVIVISITTTSILFTRKNKCIYKVDQFDR